MAPSCIRPFQRGLLDLGLNQSVHRGIFFCKFGFESEQICFEDVDALKILCFHILCGFLSRSLLGDLARNEPLQALDLLGKFDHDALKGSRVASVRAL